MEIQRQTARSPRTARSLRNRSEDAHLMINEMEKRGGGRFIGKKTRQEIDGINSNAVQDRASPQLNSMSVGPREGEGEGADEKVGQREGPTSYERNWHFTNWH